MEKVKIDERLCKSCGMCISICPVKILKTGNKLNEKGYHPVEVTDQDKCISCGFCVLICPDIAIELYKEAKV